MNNYNTIYKIYYCLQEDIKSDVITSNKISIEFNENKNWNEIPISLKNSKFSQNSKRKAGNVYYDISAQARTSHKNLDNLNKLSLNKVVFKLLLSDDNEYVIGCKSKNPKLTLSHKISKNETLDFKLTYQSKNPIPKANS